MGSLLELVNAGQKKAEMRRAVQAALREAEEKGHPGYFIVDEGQATNEVPLNRTLPAKPNYRGEKSERTHQAGVDHERWVKEAIHRAISRIKTEFSNTSWVTKVGITLIGDSMKPKKIMVEVVLADPLKTNALKRGVIASEIRKSIKTNFENLIVTSNKTTIHFVSRLSDESSI